MMIKKFVIVVLIGMFFQVNAQCKKKDKVLLTIENEKVYSSEFLRVFNKNRDVVSEENKKDITEYLDLFINYKLKLRDAKALKLDTVKSYLNEYKKYKEQLIEPFLKDRNVSDLLVKEAYDRLTKEVKASHILILVKPNAMAKDTLAAYNKLIEARNIVLSGNKPFNDVAKKYSQDPSAKENGGSLGYFSAFSMVYPFETVAYNTKVNEISMPFRTKFGFHIVKVFDVRESKGEIKVAHIMIRDKKTDTAFAKKQIDDIYNKFKQGEKFKLLATKYSDDKSSAVKGGVIKRFSQGKMIQPFADIAFALKKVGDVSKPFETKYGWHFVKLMNQYPVKSFDEMKEELTKKVEKGERSVLIGKSIANKLKKKYTYHFSNDLYNKAFATTKLTKSKEESNPFDSKTILVLENEKYPVSALRSYLKKSPNKNHVDFIDDKMIAYYKDHLEFENEDFAATLKEYRDGLLLFDLLQMKIWTKAEKDTIGLHNFFNKNRSNYNWQKRVQADIASCTKKEKSDLVLKYMNEGKSVKEIKKLVNDGATIHVLFHSGTYELDSERLPENFVATKGAKLFKEDETHFTIVNTSEILNSAPKELKDIKGKVISNYQDYLEKEWIKELRSRYSVKLEKKVFKKIVKKNS